jgi:hypothetical protein
MSRWRSRLRMWMREQRRRSSLSLPVVVIQVIIILSGVTASLCEAVAQSKDLCMLHRVLTRHRILI